MRKSHLRFFNEYYSRVTIAVLRVSDFRWRRVAGAVGIGRHTSSPRHKLFSLSIQVHFLGDAQVVEVVVADVPPAQVAAERHAQLQEAAHAGEGGSPAQLVHVLV